jgi:ABC-type transporter Mla subunit MlaD
MRRILISITVGLVAAGFAFFTIGASNPPDSTGTYKVELDNAFGLVNGEDFKIAGVRAGTIKSIDLPSACQKGDTSSCHALVTIQVTQSGFGQFHTDATCMSRPQSLIGEYFLTCDTGHAASTIKPGGTIPVANTQSTIPADLLQNIMRLPYRQRLALIINELGAGVAGRSGDLQAALQRAVPALTETDNLLNLLANDSHTLQQLTVNSDSVITTLANNNAQVKRFIDEAGNIGVHTAHQQVALKGTFHNLPALLEQLRPALAKLGAAADANRPALVNLDAAAGQLRTLFTNLAPCSQPHTGNQCGFANAALPALKSLGKASVTGKTAVEAARPTIRHLNAFAKPTPELAQNLAIVLHDLDDQGRAVERDPRSPGGRGFSGLQALLGYVFNQALAINTFGPFGHELTVDGFIDLQCTPYATPATVATNLATFGPGYRRCYSWLGPNQPGVNEPDPSNPSACVPDPGGAPPGHAGPTGVSACKLSAARVAQATGKAAGQPAAGSKAGTTSHTAAGGGSSGGTSATGPPINLKQTLNNLFGSIVGGLSGLGGVGSGPGGAATGNASSSNSGSETRQLLNYLLAP